MRVGRLMGVVAIALAPFVVRVSPLAAQTSCDPNYEGCVPIASDVDCAGGGGDGPAYTDQVNFRVIGNDPYDLDRDGNKVACEDASRPAYVAPAQTATTQVTTEPAVVVTGVYAAAAAAPTPTTVRSTTFAVTGTSSARLFAVGFTMVLLGGCLIALVKRPTARGRAQAAGRWFA